VARNRKRAKERRARRPQPVASARQERDDAPGPIRHAAPDVELAEAQMALGRPELVAESDAAAEDEPFGADGERGGRGGDGRDGEGGAPPEGGGGLAAPGTPSPPERLRAGNRLINFLQGSWRELQRVQWPDRRQVVQATGVVIGFVIVAGIYLGVADTLAAKLMNFVLK
jgi:preprotein translocase SecE subunit